MRVLNLFLLCSLIWTIQAWSNADYELFELNRKVKEDLGEDVTFYSWLKLAKGPQSKFDEINKAYKQVSRKIHPDKIKDKNLRKEGEERFQRLSLVGKVLRSEQKDRYDFFLSNGFPKLVNNGYYYSNFRPGLVSALVLIFLIAGAFQHIGLTINRNQDRKRLVSLIQQIKQNAWSNGLPPKDLSDRKLYNQETGKTFLVKFDGSVYLIDEQDSNNLFPIDESDIRDPTLRDNLIFKLPVSIWNLIVGKYLPSYKIDTTIKSEFKSDPDAEIKSSNTRNKKPKGEKIELPNGKIIYGRNNAKSRK